MKKLVTIIGHSGSGKSLIENGLTEGGLLFKKIVSTTTRPIRPGEEDGVSYHYVDDETFEGIKSNGGFVEAVEYGTKETTGIAFKYGITKEEADIVKESNCVAVVTPHGHEELCKYLGRENVIPIFVKTDDDHRKLKALNRYGELAPKYFNEVQRRFEADKLTFADVEKIENIITIHNDYTESSLAENVMKIIKLVYHVDRF